MAVPSVIRLLPAGRSVGAPAEGPAGGRTLIEIYGDGFRLPPAEAAFDAPGAVEASLVTDTSPPTVRVTFGGVEALLVQVARSNRLVVMTPISPLPAEAPNWGVGAVDVVITNLDDSGVPISGETVTVANGWTYVRPKLDAGTPSSLSRIVRVFLTQWMRQVLPEVIHTTHVDWDADTSTPYVEIAKMPAIVINLTGLPENRFYSTNEGAENALSPERVETHKKGRTMDLEFEVIGISDHALELLSLLSSAVDFMERNKWVELDGRKYELDYLEGSSFNPGNRPSSSNIHFFNGNVVIRGFTVFGLAGVAGDEIWDLTRTLKDGVSLDVERVTG